MKFYGISKDFSLVNEEQYDTIGQFWDELSLLYGLENLQGLGYSWRSNIISYAIGLKDDCIKGCNFSIELPDDGWVIVEGQTENLKRIYDEIYKYGMLRYEIETFSHDGSCTIKYFRK